MSAYSEIMEFIVNYVQVFPKSGILSVDMNVMSITQLRNKVVHNTFTEEEKANMTAAAINKNRMLKKYEKDLLNCKDTCTINIKGLTSPVRQDGRTLSEANRTINMQMYEEFEGPENDPNRLFYKASIIGDLMMCMDVVKGCVKDHARLHAREANRVSIAV